VASAASWVPRLDYGSGHWSWRYVEVGFGTVEFVVTAPRVSCPEHGPTAAHVPWARHDSWFSLAFEDLVVFDAIVSSKLATARRHDVSWRAVNDMCVRVATDEVKYRKGQKYLTVVCDHLIGKVIWAAKSRTKATVGAFFDGLRDEGARKLQFVTCDGVEWIRTVVAERAPERRSAWTRYIWWAGLPGRSTRSVTRNGTTSGAPARPGPPRSSRGLCWLLLRNWENLFPKQKRTIRDLDRANRRTLRPWQLREELRDILSMRLISVRRALYNWLAYASRSHLARCVRLARTIRNYRESIEATFG
jgi:transposase